MRPLAGAITGPLKSIIIPIRISLLQKCTLQQNHQYTKKFPTVYLLPPEMMVFIKMKCSTVIDC